MAFLGSLHRLSKKGLQSNAATKLTGCRGRWSYEVTAKVCARGALALGIVFPDNALSNYSIMYPSTPKTETLYLF